MRCDLRTAHPAHGDCVGATERQIQLLDAYLGTLERYQRAVILAGHPRRSERIGWWCRYVLFALLVIDYTAAVVWWLR